MVLLDKTEIKVTKFHGKVGARTREGGVDIRDFG